jgi:hypothetical protein
LASDYLLASERGVYEKFNLSSCCLQIDDLKIKKGHKRDHRQNKKAYPCSSPDLEMMGSQ